MLFCNGVIMPDNEFIFLILCVDGSGAGRPKGETEKRLPMTRGLNCDLGVAEKVK